MSPWTATASIVILLALAGMVAAGRLVADAAGDLARSTRSLAELGRDVDGLTRELRSTRVLGGPGPRRDGPRRDEGSAADR